MNERSTLRFNYAHQDNIFVHKSDNKTDRAGQHPGFKIWWGNAYLKEDFCLFICLNQICLGTTKFGWTQKKLRCTSPNAHTCLRACGRTDKYLNKLINQSIHLCKLVQSWKQMIVSMNKTILEK